MTQKNKDDRLHNNNFIEACSNAINGIVYSATTQSNVKKELVIGTIVLILSLFFDYSTTEFLCLVFAIFFVLFAEMINTAIETVVDLFVDVYHPKAKIAKDVAAGAVLLSAANAIIVGYFLFFKQTNILRLSDSILNIMISSKYHLAFVAILLSVIMVIFTKAVVETKRLRTGVKPGFVPSGQSLVAFAVFTVIWLNTTNPIILTSALILSVLVAGNRLNDTRTTAEVLFGSFMGVLIVLMVYSLLLVGKV